MPYNPYKDTYVPHPRPYIYSHHHQVPLQLVHGMMHEATKQQSGRALHDLLAASDESHTGARMTLERCVDLLEKQVEPCLASSSASTEAREERLDLFARAGEELQRGRPRPTINLLNLCKQVIEIYREGVSEPSRKRKAI